MISRVIEILSILEKTRTTQQRKNALYQEVMSLRSRTAKDADCIGFNLLHWAVLSNQSQTVITHLINEDKIDINCGTKLIYPITVFNITPFHLAVQTGNAALAEILINHGANPDIRRKSLHELQGPFSGNDYSYVTDINETTAEFALRKGNAAYKLFEKGFAEKYRISRTNDQREYKSNLPVCIATLFHPFNRQQKLDAENAYEKLLLNKKNEDPKTWLSTLKNLKNTQPAIDQGELGKMYQASLMARRFR